MRAVEWIAALVGATICVLGAIVTAENQLKPFELSQSPAQILWPLPGLALIDWAALGLLGLAFVAPSNIHQAWIWSKFTWAICGALVVLMILGAFSIGPYVMWAVLCFAIAGALAWAYQKPRLVADLLALALGAFGNLLLLLTFILLGRR
jgi:hypothetical protein